MAILHLLSDAEDKAARRSAAAAALLQLSGGHRLLQPSHSLLLILPPLLLQAPPRLAAAATPRQADREQVACPEAVLEVLHCAEAAQAAGREDADAAAQRLALLHAVRCQHHRVACRAGKCHVSGNWLRPHIFCRELVYLAHAIHKNSAVQANT